MIFLPVQFRTRSTRSLLGIKIRGLLQGQREGALRCTREPMTCPTRTLCMLWENVISLIVFSEHFYRFGVYKQWEADFLRHLLGYTTFEEERDFSDGCTLNFRLRDDSKLCWDRIGEETNSLVETQQPLKNYMYPYGAVELSHVWIIVGKPVNAFEQCKFGRYFAAFIQGINKQRYFVEVELKDDWFLSTDRLPWKIFIGCNQGHSTGIVNPLRTLTSWPWWNFIVLVGFFMWQI